MTRRLRRRSAGCVNTLNDGCKLDVTATDVAEEAIELQRTVDVETVDHGHGIPFNTMPVEKLDAAHHIVERVAAHGIVKTPWTVNGYAYKEIVVAEKAAPFISKQRAVGLETVVDMSAAGIPLLQA